MDVRDGAGGRGSARRTVWPPPPSPRPVRGAGRARHPELLWELSASRTGRGRCRPGESGGVRCDGFRRGALGRRSHRDVDSLDRCTLRLMEGSASVILPLALDSRCGTLPRGSSQSLVASSDESEEAVRAGRMGFSWRKWGTRASPAAPVRRCRRDRAPARQLAPACRDFVFATNGSSPMTSRRASVHAHRSLRRGRPAAVCEPPRRPGTIWITAPRVPVFQFEGVSETALVR
jgi:hypothetical protein